MIRVSNIKVPLGFNFGDLKGLCFRQLKIPEKSLISVKLSRKSVDARRKNDVHFIVSVDIVAKGEQKLLKQLKNAAPIEEFTYEIPQVTVEKSPVVVGFGPAGMFAALVLAMAGAKPIVLERGQDVDSRVKSVKNFQSGGMLNPESNVQFGEGGAGTFSDGKLTTGIKDKRIQTILKWLVEFGAPEEIAYLAKPHIGTDKLRDTVKNLRKRVIELGGDVRFEAKFDGYTTDNGCITSVSYTDSEGSHTIETDNVILATGHSARDVFEMLHDKNVDMSQKNFAVGMRIEHLRSCIDKAMYGDFAGHPALKAADYKLAIHLPDGRALYTFCMCPGGEVVAASSEEGRLAVNGMSYFARDSVNSNSALLVNVTPEDFGSDHPLAGMYFQREIEEKAFIAGGTDYSAPVILVGDFLEDRLSVEFGRVQPSYRPKVKFTMPQDYLPDFICRSIKAGIVEMGRKIKGFDDKDAVLTGVESRSSSPVRINRGENLESLSVGGLFPCGEGAGYAGGIVSAAVDGMKCAEAVLRRI
ncbi:MAG: FAD-dependent oxidoreductase [Ruminococcus sp.]|nr:FAD-dependent oxidoreductase [Ruminococcus sp.]